jgi:hypothetical protein
VTTESVSAKLGRVVHDLPFDGNGN